MCPSWWACSDTEHRCRKADVPFLCAQGQGAAFLDQAWGLTPWEREPGMLSDKESCAGKWVRARWHLRRWQRRIGLLPGHCGKEMEQGSPHPKGFPSTLVPHTAPRRGPLPETMLTMW